MITIQDIIVYDQSKRPINFFSVVNLMEDKLRESIGYVSPQELFDIYSKKFEEKYQRHWNYLAAAMMNDG